MSDVSVALEVDASRSLDVHVVFGGGGGVGAGEWTVCVGIWVWVWVWVSRSIWIGGLGMEVGGVDGGGVRSGVGLGIVRVESAIPNERVDIIVLVDDDGLRSVSLAMNCIVIVMLSRHEIVEQPFSRFRAGPVISHDSRLTADGAMPSSFVLDRQSSIEIKIRQRRRFLPTMNILVV